MNVMPLPWRFLPFAFLFIHSIASLQGISIKAMNEALRPYSARCENYLFIQHSSWLLIHDNVLYNQPNSATQLSSCANFVQKRMWPISTWGALSIAKFHISLKFGQDEKCELM